VKVRINKEMPVLCCGVERKPEIILKWLQFIEITFLKFDRWLCVPALFSRRYSAANGQWHEWYDGKEVYDTIYSCEENHLVPKGILHFESPYDALPI
jgi:hypothetical protein